MTNVQTDNSFLQTKVKLRIDNLPNGICRVLDCYAGSGLIWTEIKRQLPGRKIRALRIDQKTDLPGLYLHGDNLKFLSVLDLNKFNVIDLDAYGVPFEQLRIIFSRKLNKHIVVFVTFIQSLYGALATDMLMQIGYSRSMISKCETLFYRNGLEKFKQFLAINNVTQIKRYSFHGDKTSYLCFRL